MLTHFNNIYLNIAYKIYLFPRSDWFHTEGFFAGLQNQQRSSLVCNCTKKKISFTLVINNNI